MYSELVPVILPVLICIAIGYGWAKSGIPFEREFVTRAAMNVAAPCLILDGVGVLGEQLPVSRQRIGEVYPRNEGDVSGTVHALVRFVLLLLVPVDRPAQESVLVKVSPEGGVGSCVLSLKLHLLSQGLDRGTKQILDALRDMPLVFKMVLNARNAVSTDGTLLLRAGTMIVE